MRARTLLPELKQCFKSLAGKFLSNQSNQDSSNKTSSLNTFKEENDSLLGYSAV
jgi:hypothetical protein